MDKRKRFSLQNKNLVKSQLNKIEEEKDEKEKTNEEEKNEQNNNPKINKYLNPIEEEVDPLKYFDENNKEETGQDPLKFLKRNYDLFYKDEILGHLALEDEDKMKKAIMDGDLPEELEINRDVVKRDNEEKKRKIVQRGNTSLILSQRRALMGKAKENILKRMQNTNKIADANEAIKMSEEKSKKKGDNLLGDEAQVEPTKNVGSIKKTKEIDLKSFMEKPK